MTIRWYIILADILLILGLIYLLGWSCNHCKDQPKENTEVTLAVQKQLLNNEIQKAKSETEIYKDSCRILTKIYTYKLSHVGKLIKTIHDTVVVKELEDFLITTDEVKTIQDSVISEQEKVNQYQDSLLCFYEDNFNLNAKDKIQLNLELNKAQTKIEKKNTAIKILGGVGLVLIGAMVIK